ncbi:hypothetical protein [Bdellovibrio sp. HCB2-146]|uniref:hypothetical protein n=1 Tax=Bdellovibrio sp. HCB2-146 TaxID=3394362 RepID=UPI0039BD150D
MKRLFKTFPLIIFIFLGSLAQADVRYVGNAGTGVLIDDVPYLLDLYEVDNTNPLIDESVQPLPEYVTALLNLDILTSHEIKLLAIKLTEVRQFAPSYADSLVVAANQYVWRLVSTPLTLLPDASPVEVNNKLVQLANRYGPYVRINQTHWNKLPSSNRVALVLHEMISATLELTKVPGQPHLFNQDIAAVRNRVAYIFLPQFKSRGAQAFLNLTGVQWGLSKLVDKHTYELTQNILSWKIANGDDVLNIHSQFVSNNGLDEGFCRLIAEKLKTTTSITSTFYYSSAMVSLSFINYNSSFGTQSALEETAPNFHWKQIVKIEFTDANAADCLKILEKATAEVFRRFNMPTISRIEQFPRRVRIGDDSLN